MKLGITGIISGGTEVAKLLNNSEMETRGDYVSVHSKKEKKKKNGFIIGLLSSLAPGEICPI